MLVRKCVNIFSQLTKCTGLVFMFVLCFETELYAKIPTNVAIGILTRLEITSFYQCQYESALIRNALKFNLPLPYDIPRRTISANDVSFVLFTRKNLVPQFLKISPYEVSIRTSSFNPQNRIVLFTNGYNVSYKEAAARIPSVLLQSLDLNIVIVNWDSYISFGLQYSRNITVPLLSEIIAQFTQQMIKVGADPKKMYFIGFSLGGEAVGLAAKKIQPRIDRLLALDPAGSCYNFLPPTQRVASTDADFVIIVHCSAGYRALPAYILGDATFFINGAYIQPECANLPTIFHINDCSHRLCIDHFYESLVNFNQSFGVRCYDYGQYLQKVCDCRDIEPSGFYTPKSARGLYFVDNDPFLASERNPTCVNDPSWFRRRR